MNKAGIVVLITLILMLMFFGIAWGLFIFTGGLNLENEYGDVVTEQLFINEEFDEVKLDGFGELLIVQGDKTELLVTTQEGVVDKISAEVRAGILVIDENLLDGGFYILSYTPSPEISYTLTVQDLNEIELSGAGTIEIEKFESDFLKLEVSGAGGLEAGNLKVENLEAVMAGLGSIEVGSFEGDTIETMFKGAGGMDINDGSVRFQSLELAGLGAYDARGLESDVAEITISGAGGAEVSVKEELDATIEGMGSLDYYGDPKVSRNVEGLGSITGHN